MHPRQPELQPPLANILEAALADAGYELDEALLYVFDAEKSASGFEAFNYPRGAHIDDQEVAEVGGFVEELNHPEAREAVRIVLFSANRSEEGTAAVIRHELEHARQVASLGLGILGLYDLCARVLMMRAGGLPGSGAIYTLMPIEMDANAAGAVFATARYGRERIVQLLDQGDRSGAALRSNVGPEPIDTLPERMVAFMIANRRLCMLYAEEYGNGLSFRQMLDLEWPGAGDVWEQLTEGGGMDLPRDGL